MIETTDTKIVAPPSQRASKERISKAMRHACDLIASGECKTIKAAAERAGLSRTHLNRMLGRPHIQAFIERETRRTIATGKLRAGHRLVELLDAASEHVSLDAAKHTLAIEGIAPPERNGGNVNVSIGIQAGYVIDLAGAAQSVSHGPSTIEPD